ARTTGASKSSCIRTDATSRETEPLLSAGRHSMAAGPECRGDRLVHAAIPRFTVPGKQNAGVRAAESFHGLQCSGAVGGRGTGDDLRPASAGVRVKGHDRVAAH